MVLAGRRAILLSTWKGIGYRKVFLLTGLQQIARSMAGAASLDGASGFHQSRG